MLLKHLIIPFLTIAIVGCNSSESTSVDGNSQIQPYPDFGMPWKSGVAYATYQDPRDGNVYRTIKVNSKEWMSENLRYNDGTSGCYWNTGSNYCEKFGRLYLWSDAMDTAISYNAALLAPNSEASQGVCPSGWRMPSENDWMELEMFAGGSAKAGKSLKSTTGWLPISGTLVQGTDSIGFRAIPSGYRDTVYAPYGEGLIAAFWASNEIDRKFAKARVIRSDLGATIDSTARKTNKFSVRCVRG